MMTKKAVALKYKQAQQSAPSVVASGKGAIAEQIIKRAVEFDIPIFQNGALVDSLVDLNLGAEIPPRLYQAVVEVFVWLNSAEKRAQLSQG